MWTMRCLVVGTVLAVAVPVSAQSGGSADLAKQLVEAASAQQLDAVAAPDPAAADRFVAALIIPSSQLLVVSAAYPTPALMTQQIAARNYRDAYLTLLQAGSRDGKRFYQDLGADGLRWEGGAVDVLYENGVDQYLLDRTHRPKGMSEAAYQEKFSKADQRYCQLLSMLLERLKPQAGSKQ